MQRLNMRHNLLDQQTKTMMKNSHDHLFISKGGRHCPKGVNPYPGMVTTLIQDKKPLTILCCHHTTIQVKKKLKHWDGANEKGSECWQICTKVWKPSQILWQQTSFYYHSSICRPWFLVYTRPTFYLSLALHHHRSPLSFCRFTLYLARHLLLVRACILLIHKQRVYRKGEQE